MNLICIDTRETETGTRYLIVGRGWISETEVEEAIGELGQLVDLDSEAAREFNERRRAIP